MSDGAFTAARPPVTLRKWELLAPPDPARLFPPSANAMVISGWSKGLSRQASRITRLARACPRVIWVGTSPAPAFVRLAEGIDPARYARLAGRPLNPQRVALLREQGAVETTANGMLRVTLAGFPVLDAVVADLAA